MAATSSVNNFHDIVPPGVWIRRPKYPQRLAELNEYIKKEPDLTGRIPVRIEWLVCDDYETFKKRFEKVPKQVLGCKDYAAYTVMFIVVAGSIYFMVKLFRSTNAKL